MTPVLPRNTQSLNPAVHQDLDEDLNSSKVCLFYDCMATLYLRAIVFKVAYVCVCRNTICAKEGIAKQQLHQLKKFLVLL